MKSRISAIGFIGTAVLWMLLGFAQGQFSTGLTHKVSNDTAGELTVETAEKIIPELLYACTDDGTTVAGGSGLSMVRTGVGLWTVTLDAPHPLGTLYKPVATAEEEGNLRDTPDITVVQGSKTATGFQLQINTGDNGGGADVLVDTPFCVCVDKPCPITYVTGVSFGNSCENLEDITVQRPLAVQNWANEPVQSAQAISGDGEFCFTASAETGNTPQMLGLNSDPTTNASYTSIDYAVYLYNNGGTYLWRVYENGAFKFTLTTNWVGQETCVRRTGTTVEYLLGGVVQYTSLIPSSAPLFADSSFYSQTAGTWAGGSITMTDMSLCATGGGTLEAANVKRTAASITGEKSEEGTPEELAETETF